MMKSGRMRWAWHATRIWENKDAYRLFVGKPERERPLGIATCRWLDNIKRDLGEIGRGGVN
jgi:hypothetical protein